MAPEDEAPEQAADPSNGVVFPSPSWRPTDRPETEPRMLHEVSRELFDATDGMLRWFAVHDPERLERPGFRRMIEAALSVEDALDVDTSGLADPSTATPAVILLSSTVAQARDWLRKRLRNGEQCPACDQRVQMYRRPLPAVSVRTLAIMYRAAGQGWVHLPTLLETHAPDIAHQGGYTSLGVHWGLLTEEPTARPDGGRAGYWRVSEDGVRFLAGDLAVQKYVLLYNQRCLGFEGPEVTAQDALGNKFDLQEVLHPTEDQAA